MASRLLLSMGRSFCAVWFGLGFRGTFCRGKGDEDENGAALVRGRGWGSGPPEKENGPQILGGLAHADRRRLVLVDSDLHVGAGQEAGGDEGGRARSCSGRGAP